MGKQRGVICIVKVFRYTSQSPSYLSSSATNHSFRDQIDPQNKQIWQENAPLFQTGDHAECFCQCCIADQKGFQVSV